MNSRDLPNTPKVLKLFDCILETLCQSEMPESHAKDIGVAILRSKQIIIDEYERLRDAEKLLAEVMQLVNRESYAL